MGYYLIFFLSEISSPWRRISIDIYLTGPREQINQITSFIDGGVVYGDSELQWLNLVDLETGKHTFLQQNSNPTKRQRLFISMFSQYDLSPPSFCHWFTHPTTTSTLLLSRRVKDLQTKQKYIMAEFRIYKIFISLQIVFNCI